MPNENTSSKGDIYVSHKPGAGIDTVVLVGAKHVDLTAQQARDLFECLRDVLGVTLCPISVPHGPHHTPGVAPCGGVDDPSNPDPRINKAADPSSIPGGAPFVHLLKAEVGAACGLPLRLVDSCATDVTTVTCVFCLDLPEVES